MPGLENPTPGSGELTSIIPEMLTLGSDGLTSPLPRLTGAEEVDQCGKRMWPYASRCHSVHWRRPVSSP